ncbi:MAG TPA: hypothetical protein VFQ02_03270 [Nitrospira sp.]|jgi:hypothetical protein|nr:hypothetical protein [Nitrospira sp.]
MIDESESTRLSDDVKELTIAGCRVRLVYSRATDDRWIVKGTMQCGIEDQQGEGSIVTEAYHSREEAEQNAVERVMTLLGEQTDRSHSRVRNWS